MKVGRGVCLNSFLVWSVTTVSRQMYFLSLSWLTKNYEKKILVTALKILMAVISLIIMMNWVSPDIFLIVIFFFGFSCLYSHLQGTFMLTCQRLINFQQIKFPFVFLNKEPLNPSTEQMTSLCHFRYASFLSLLGFSARWQSKAPDSEEAPSREITWQGSGPKTSTSCLCAFSPGLFSGFTEMECRQ